MPKTDQSTLFALADTLTIDAFDQFRSAAQRAELPLPVINAFAAYKTAVDFALLAAKAHGSADHPEAMKLVGWAFSTLGDMRAELAMMTGAGANYPDH